jgi:AAA domain
MQQPSDNIPHEDPTRQNPLDEPPWSPELLDAIERTGHMWLCHDQDDAALLLRPDAGDLPALCLPIHQVHLLTSELVKPLQIIVVIQRPDNVLGDTFYARYGLKVKQQLEGVIDGTKTLYRIPLDDIIPTLSRLWSFVQQDGERFQQELANLQMATRGDEIKPKRRAKTSRLQGPRPVIVHADRVQAQAILWLWRPYIPRGMLVLLDGDPGLGKGLMLVQVATNLSKGLPFLDQLGKPTLFPDIDGPQTTLILTAEESLSHVMIPRLERAGADLRHIKFLTGWLGPEDEEHAFDLQHLPVLVQAIKELMPVLVILDPLVAYLGDIDMHKSSQTRPVMASLKGIAERYGCTILGVRHPAKVDQGGRLMYRGQGNMDLIGAARSGLWVQPHPVYPETQTILIQSKTNVGTLGRTVIFSRDQGEFAWKSVSRLTEAMVTGKGPDPWATLEAFFWLEDYMRPGIACKASDVEKAAAEKEIGKKPLERAKKWLGIYSRQVTGGWTWTLPPLTL